MIALYDDYVMNYEYIIGLIQSEMKVQKISYRKMGNIVDCDYTSFSQWFHFKRIMSAKMMLKLLQVLGIEFNITGGTNND